MKQRKLTDDTRDSQIDFLITAYFNNSVVLPDGIPPEWFAEGMENIQKLVEELEVPEDTQFAIHAHWTFSWTGSTRSIEPMLKEVRSGLLLSNWLYEVNKPDHPDYNKLIKANIVGEYD
ncbi:MAG: hypothetical protein H7831_11570 [Magnetococcus sp. WYHC-3]